MKFQPLLVIILAFLAHSELRADGYYASLSGGLNFSHAPSCSAISDAGPGCSGGCALGFLWHQGWRIELETMYHRIYQSLTVDSYYSPYSRTYDISHDILTGMINIGSLLPKLKYVQPYVMLGAGTTLLHRIREGDRELDTQFVYQWMVGAEIPIARKIYSGLKYRNLHLSRDFTIHGLEITVRRPF